MILLLYDVNIKDIFIFVLIKISYISLYSKIFEKFQISKFKYNKISF